jgi:hypothetical protein
MAIQESKDFEGIEESVRSKVSGSYAGVVNNVNVPSERDRGRIIEELMKASDRGG